MTIDEIVILHKKKTILRVEYGTLSRVREEFPRKSNHKAVTYIEKRLTVIIEEIDKINKEFEMDKQNAS